MTEFLAPLNYDRAQDALRRLSVYTAYSPEGAAVALNVLKTCYPLVFSKTEVKPFARDAVLVELAGANVTDPLVFTSHLDVPEGCEGEGAPPMHGLPLCVPLSRAHGVALLEALEELLKDGYRPGGDLFLCLSMDGLSGGEGAKSMAAYLEARSIRPCFVLDFGGYATMDLFRTWLPKDAPLALIGVAEKGLLLGRVAADGDESEPVDALLRCGARLTRHARRAALCGASEMMLRELGRRTGFLRRLATRHARLTFPLLCFFWRGRTVLRQFFASETTVYALDARGTALSPARQAELRLCQTMIPGEKPAAVRKRLRRRIGNPELRLQVEMEYDHARRSEPVGEAWDALETAIEIQFERAVIVPCLCPFFTDGRFYSAMGGKVYRFSPFMVTGEEARRGVCTVTDGALQTAVQFFRSMLSV